jgi:aldehyde dehydrogenase (NAD+)
MESPQLFFGGRWQDAEGGERYPIINPATEDVIGSAPQGRRGDVQRAVNAARKAFDEGPWPQLGAEERHRLLRRIADGMAKSKDRLRQLLIAEAGATHALLSYQLDWPLEFMQDYAERAARLEREEMLPSAVAQDARSAKVRMTLVNRQAAGVCGLIPTWNFPLYVTIQKLGPALATGCTVVVKAPPYTPLINLELARIVAEADLPAGVFNIVTGTSPELGEELCANPAVDKISFTGSVPTGKRIMEAASKTLKRVHLELGGKSANIVLDDARIDEAAASIAAPAYAHSGQGCALATRALVPKTLHDALVQRMVEFVRGRVKIGNPADPTVLMGPLIREERRVQVEEFIAAGTKEGARLATGGKRPSGFSKGFFLEPTIFTEVHNQMRIAREEIFGPVLCVIPYDTVDDAIRIANDSRYGLGAAITTSQPARGMEIAKRLRAGHVTINARANARIAPFGGFKESGIGREGGRFGVEDYTEIQNISWEA